MKRNFLIVAANAQAREALASGLRAAGFTVTRAANGAEAERVAQSVSLDAAIIESHLPDMSADDLQQRIKRVRPDCRVATVSSFEQIKNSPAQLKYGANDYLLNAEQLLPLLGAPFESNEGATDTFAERGNDALIGVIDVLVSLLEIEDAYFGGMSHRAMTLGRQVAEQLGADSQIVQEVVLATLLRDVGKVSVAPEVFTEPGRLTDEQKQSMQDHVQASVRLFEHIAFPWKALPIIRHHHERYDGGGYPDGLRAREIPMGARIVAVVDTFVALTSDRTHRDALDAEAALQQLIAQAGRQFDPEVVEAFQKVIDKRLATRKPNAKPTVLIADSQKDFRKLLKMRLINEDLEVRETRNCASALKIMLKNPPDIVLMDLDLPVVDGWEATRRLRGDPRTRHIPISALTAHAMQDHRIRAKEAGCDEFVTKPVDLEELVEKIERLVAVPKEDSGVSFGGLFGAQDGAEPIYERGQHLRLAAQDEGAAMCRQREP